jgi:hypothetical protein
MLRWKFIGIDFHRRWRSGKTILDLSYNCLLSHHGFYSLEWARGPHIDHYRSVRAERRSKAVA